SPAWSSSASNTDATAARHRPAPSPAPAARPSSRSQSRAPAANAPSRFRCARQTRSPVAPADHQPACVPDSESAACALATTARSAPTTDPKPPTALPVPSTPPPTLTTDADGLRYPSPGPSKELELLGSQNQVPSQPRLHKAVRDGSYGEAG